MEAIQVLEDVLAKTAKKTSNENRKRAVDALLALFAEGNDSKQVVEYLIKFHYSVCQSFFEAFASSGSEESVLGAAEALINDEQFRKGNSNNIMYPKGLSAVFALASKEKYQPAFLVLNHILSQSEKSAIFSKGCINNFKKIIVDKGGLPFIIDLLTRVTEGTAACKEYEQKRLVRFLKTWDDKVVTISKDIGQPIAQECITSSQISPKQNQVNPGKSPSEQPQNTGAAEILLSGQFAQTQQDILATLRKLADSHSTVESLSSTVSRRDAELSAIRADMSEKDRRIATLSSEITKKDKQLNDAESQIADLTERLRTSFQMDDISKSQGLITLKNDISEALKLDYADFVKSKENPYSQDLFEAYRPTLTRIFKLLKRFGITCQ